LAAWDPVRVAFRSCMSSAVRVSRQAGENWTARRGTLKENAEKNCDSVESSAWRPVRARRKRGETESRPEDIRDIGDRGEAVPMAEGDVSMNLTERTIWGEVAAIHRVRAEVRFGSPGFRKAVGNRAESGGGRRGVIRLRDRSVGLQLRVGEVFPETGVAWRGAGVDAAEAFIDEGEAGDWYGLFVVRCAWRLSRLPVRRPTVAAEHPLEWMSTSTRERSSVDRLDGGELGFELVELGDGFRSRSRFRAHRVRFLSALRLEVALPRGARAGTFLGVAVLLGFAVVHKMESGQLWPAGISCALRVKAAAIRGMTGKWLKRWEKIVGLWSLFTGQNSRGSSGGKASFPGVRGLKASTGKGNI